MDEEGTSEVLGMAYQSLYITCSKKVRLFFTMFIKRYTITNYETAKYEYRTSETDQQSGEVAQEVLLRAEGDKTFDRGVQDIEAAGISLCTRSGQVVEGDRSTRRKRSIDYEVAYEHNRANPEIETQDR